MKIISYLTVLFFLVSCAQNKVAKPVSEATDEMDSMSKTEETHLQKMRLKKDSITDFSILTEADWKEILTDQEYYILREKGTERAFSGKYNEFKAQGTFVCRGCATPLYLASTKFDSGTGWPSFYDKIGNNVLEEVDNSYGMKRTEIVCATCKGHLGHVFDDGPKPTGLRHCVNSVSLDFVPN